MFYAQFENVVIVTMKSLGVTLIVMFLLKGILLGLSLLVAPLITAALALFTINLLGLLSLLGIAFSDVVLVNVIIVSNHITSRLLIDFFNKEYNLYSQIVSRKTIINQLRFDQGFLFPLLPTYDYH